MVKDLLDKNDQHRYLNLFKMHPGIRDALDGIIPIRCLWPDLRLSILHKVVAMKCDDVW